LLYIGKAKNLRQRVRSYFSSQVLLPKIQALVSRIAKVKVLPTASETDALLLEAELIRQHQPKYNSELKDNKSYPRIKIKDGVIRIVHRETDPDARYYGPYPAGRKIRQLLRAIRKIFPYATQTHKKGEFCFYGRLGLCPCQTPEINLPKIEEILAGRRQQLVKNLQKQMRACSRTGDFETALTLKRQIDLLSGFDLPVHEPWEYQLNPNLAAETARHQVKALCDLLKLPCRENFRLEGYDISHLSGTAVVASMVVFVDGEKETDQYRRFKIKTDQNDDAAAMGEVLKRRFRHPDWPLPNLVLVDGPVRNWPERQTVPVIGLEKREETLVLPDGSRLKLPANHAGLRLLMAVRDEAHRFAQSYHHLLRRKKMLK
jgi:excinuclease ABC subunit C